MSTVIQQFHRRVAPQDATQIRDARLLEHFVQRHDEAAFASLVRLYGPLVFGVCRRVLGNYHDAEEAFQATFLILSQKAASLHRPEMLANWLYGVAHRTALNAKGLRAKARKREVCFDGLPEAMAARTDRWAELTPLLDDELSRLSERYRIPIILCDLQGQTRKAAARQIGCPEGTLVSRLLKGRTMLAARLTRRGVALSAGSMLVLLSQNPTSAEVPASTIGTLARAARINEVHCATAQGIVSSRVAALAESVGSPLFPFALKVTIAALALILGLGWGGSVLISAPLGGKIPLSAYKAKPREGVALVKPVISLSAENVRDQSDMCVWVHPVDGSRSTVISSNKRSDLICVYDLDGSVLQRVPVQNPKCVDTRQQVRLNGELLDLVVVAHRAERFLLHVFRVNPSSRLLERMDAGDLETGPSSGGCVYHSRRTGKLYFIGASERGIVEQHELLSEGESRIRNRLVRSWALDDCEGAVADDETGQLYLAAKDVGVWKFPAEPDVDSSGELIAPIGEHGFRGDAEGLALVRGAGGSGFVVVSDQGSSCFLLYDRRPPHRFVGKFSVEGAQRTHGIEACEVDLGPNFLGGAFICHSGKHPWPLLITPLSSITDQLGLVR